MDIEVLTDIMERGKNDLPSGDYLTLCNILMKLYKVPYRKCIECKKENIGIHEPTWKKMCLACYKKNKKNSIKPINASVFFTD